MPSGHAYAKAMRTVKTCVGSEWCRFGTQDSTQMGKDLERALWRMHAPHKVKLAGQRVVRLKGSDPFIFGRGGEEAQALRAHGIEVEVANGSPGPDWAVLGAEAAQGLTLVIYMGMARLAADAEAQGFGSPAIVLVGDVLRAREAMHHTGAKLSAEAA
jgi:siroheme synthase